MRHVNPIIRNIPKIQQDSKMEPAATPMVNLAPKTVFPLLSDLSLKYMQIILEYTHYGRVEIGGELEEEK